MEKQLALLLTKRQAAHELAISSRTLEALVASGAIAPTRIGRAVRFSPVVLSEFVAKRTDTPPPPQYAPPARRRVGSRR